MRVSISRVFRWVELLACVPTSLADKHSDGQFAETTAFVYRFASNAAQTGSERSDVIRTSRVFCTLEHHLHPFVAISRHF